MIWLQAEWLPRAAAQFIKRAGVDQKTADDLAMTCWDTSDPMDRQFGTPEESADEEMSYWTDDEEPSVA